MQPPPASAQGNPISANTENASGGGEYNPKPR
jgi:hypothetical protein